MIVDVHTRIWESTEQLGQMAEQLRRRRAEPWTSLSASAQEHAEAMKPVNNAIIRGFQSKLLGASIPHEKVAAYVAGDPQRFLGFAGIDPAAGKPLQSLEQAISLGLKGVTISPAAQGFHPSDTRAMALYEACEAKKLPIFIEPGVMLARQTMTEFSQPMLLDEIARTFPDLKLVISSLGHPWIDQTIAMLSKHPSVYSDLSSLIEQPWRLYNALVAAHQAGVMNQLLFGSNFPFCSPEKAIVTIYSVNTLVQGTHLPSVPREQLRAMVERDSLAILGLTGSQPAVATPIPDAAPAAADTTEADDTRKDTPTAVEDAAQ